MTPNVALMPWEYIDAMWPRVLQPALAEHCPSHAVDAMAATTDIIVHLRSTMAQGWVAYYDHDFDAPAGVFITVVEIDGMTRQNNVVVWAMGEAPRRTMDDGHFIEAAAHFDEYRTAFDARRVFWYPPTADLADRLCRIGLPDNNVIFRREE